MLAFAGKKLNIRRILANPLKDEADIVKNDKYWRMAIYNSIFMGTLGTLSMSFYHSEANKLILYQKYEKEIGRYMRWRSDREIQNYLLKTQ